jgi:hypothetical protein
MALSGPRPIETVGNSQNSGMSRGWGYDGGPRRRRRPPTSWRKLSSWLLGQAALDEGPGVDAGRGVALEVDLVAGPPLSLPRKKWLKPTS